VSGGRFRVCEATELAPGQRLVVDLGGRSVGVFNVEGSFYALHNRCPHRGGALCLGPVTGVTRSTDDFEYVYADEGRILRCAWHGWEFDITTGHALAARGVSARTYPVAVEDGNILISI